MAMAGTAGALLLAGPKCTVAIADKFSTIWGQFQERKDVKAFGGMEFRNGGNHGCRGAISSCSGGLRLFSGGRNGRNCELGWTSPGCLGKLGGERLYGSRMKVSEPRKVARVAVRIAAEKIDPNNVIATLVKVGKQGLDAGTKLVPATVPRPVAQAGVGLAGLVVGSFVLRSLFSTVLFILAIGAVSYFGFLYLTKGEGGSSSGSTFDKDSGKPKNSDDALEEARKIMDKYK